LILLADAILSGIGTASSSWLLALRFQLSFSGAPSDKAANG
jgi:hypothetical protein